MYAIWVSWKENVNCGSKLRDVIGKPEKMVQKRSYSFGNDNSEIQLLHQGENPMAKSNIMQNQTPNSFYELKIGDPSRNVIEMIFRAASVYPSKHSMKIRKVLRVNNPIDILERFEKHREIVKKKAYEQYNRHPRSIVDGNEQLCFYGTTMTCCCVRKSNGLTQHCKDSYCRVCRIIQSGFRTEYNKKNGIRLSTSSQEFSENMTREMTKGKIVKRAVIVCRTIAGRVRRVVNMVDGENEEDYDSIGSGALCSKLEYLIVQNPSAVLPCFVIVFN